MEEDKERKDRTGGKRRRISDAMLFILLFGIVSLFSDMTHEGASSIRGEYLAILGASAGTIGFVSGLGEMIGYSLRLVFGRLADQTRKYWTLTIAGYVLDVVCVPALCLAGRHGWVFACVLLLLQRTGKAMKKPSKDTIMSFAASQEGAGKSFGIQELLDQIGAFLGPVMLYVIMLFQTTGSTYRMYARAFAWLAIPGAATIFFLLLTKRRFPHPENFEPEPKKYERLQIRRPFAFYLTGISLFAFGFLDYAIVVMHIGRTFVGTGSWITEQTLPLIYSAAMIVDAVAALVFGFLYDRRGTLALVLSTLLSAPFPFLIFFAKSEGVLLAGVALWGIGMGAQESILKAAVSGMIPKSSRATGYGLFECAFGICWFLGSWLLGVLYDHSLAAMAVVSFLAQLAAIPFYIASARTGKSE